MKSGKWEVGRESKKPKAKSKKQKAKSRQPLYELAPISTMGMVGVVAPSERSMVMAKALA